MHESIRNFLIFILSILPLFPHLVRPARMNWAEAIVAHGDFALQLLVMLFLSSSTTDEQCIRVGLEMVNNPEFSLRWILETPANVIQNIIRSAGRYNDVTNFMKRSAEIIFRKHGGMVPCSYTDLLELPGVGPKIATIVMKTAFNFCPVRCLILSVLLSFLAPHKLTNSPFLLRQLLPTFMWLWRHVSSALPLHTLALDKFRASWR